MKNINEWIIIKALNKHEELVVKYEDNKFYISIATYDKNKLSVKESSCIIIDKLEDLQKFLNNIEAVMTKKSNKLYLYYNKKTQDIFLNLIKYNSAFKLRDTLKVILYPYVGVNESSYCAVTISKDSCRNLYKAILIAINKMKGVEKDEYTNRR